MIISAPRLRIRPPADTWVAPVVAIEKWYDQSAYLLPHATGVNIQAALDTYGTIRLEPKDYAINAQGTHPSVPLPAPFILRTGQKIYGVHGVTGLPTVTIAAGSENSLIRGCRGTFNFPASGSVTSNVTLESIGGLVTATNTRLENCLLRDMYECSVNINTETSGYIKNCRFVRQITHSDVDSFLWLAAVGDTQSVGNNVVWLNFLTPGNKKFKIANVPELALVHLDVEAPGSDGSPALDASGMGWLWTTALTGTNATGELVKTTNVANVGITYPRGYNQSAGASVLVEGASNVIEFLHDDNRVRTFNASASQVTGYGFKPVSPMEWVTVNAADAAAVAATFTSTVSRTLAGLAWAPPTYVTPPTVPAIAASATTRADIQALLNSQGTVFLAPGKYVLDGPLLMGGGRRLIGSGMAQTFIVGADNTVTLFALDLSLPNGNKSLGTFFHLTDMTLANAYRGIWSESTLGTTSTGTNEFQLTNSCLHRLCIRDMADAGFGFTNIFGLDNNYFDNVYFVNCATGFKHMVTAEGFGTETNMYLCYMDKSVFQSCQWINCGRAFDAITKRASGGNTFIDCKIEGSTVYALRATLYDSLDFINCDLINNAGGPAGQGVGQSNGYAFSTQAICNINHCRITAGAANPAGLFASANVLYEGCTFSRGGAASTVMRTSLSAYDISHPVSTAQFTMHRYTFINCDLGDVPLGTMPTVLGINNNSSADPTFQNDWCRRDNGTSYNFSAMSARPTGTRLLRNAS